MTQAETELTWDACSDLLSGVKCYEVKEKGKALMRIFDLGEEAFGYTLTNTENGVTITAVDFAGNKSEVKLNGGGEDDVQDGIIAPKYASVGIYPNPATEVIFIAEMEVAELSVYSVHGQLVKTVFNQNAVTVSELNSGLYIVVVTDQEGNKATAKVSIR